MTSDSASGLLRVSHDRLGVVLDKVRPALKRSPGVRAFTTWTTATVDDHRLRLKTSDPSTTWMFDLQPEGLIVSSTSSDAVLLAEAPAPKQRSVARVLDPNGAPVDWAGTNEVLETYGGSATHNRSFLPTRNPEVMYFSLGQTDNAFAHSLFDAKTDMVIDFPAGASLKRARGNAEALDAEIPIPGSAIIRLVPDYFTKTLGLPFYEPFDDTAFPTAPMVWSSWTSYYEQVTEQDIVQNADWLGKNLKPYGFQFVQLDDGYDRGNNGEHYWIENWDKAKFPHGPQWLTRYIQSKGLRAGLWIVPNAYAGALKEHPEWYLRFQDGRTVPDYHTPALDSSNPQVIAFLRKLFTTLDEWGFDYYKFDGEHAIAKYAPKVDLARLYDKSADPVMVYRNRLKAIRETIGPSRFIEGCPAGSPLNGIGYMNSYFNGEDLYANWQGMYSLFSSINANGFFNHMAVYVMPGEGLELGPHITFEEGVKQKRPPLIRTERSREDPLTGLGMTPAEARTVVSFVALTGVAYPLASVMFELPEERTRLVKMTLPTMPIMPADLFSRGTDVRWGTFKTIRPDDYIHNYPEILDVKVNAAAGVYDIAAFINWRSTPLTREVSLAEKLGLDRSGRWVVFDFWRQKILPVSGDTLKVEIEPHDTRVLLIHPALSIPQLAGNSRHISGAFSVREQHWDGRQNVLQGIAETVPGDRYMLWIRVPDKFSVAGVKALTESGREIAAEQALEGTALRVSFPGQAEAVKWEARFSARATPAAKGASR